MKILVPCAIGGLTSGIVLYTFLGKDPALVATSVTGALSYSMVVYSLLPMMRQNPIPRLVPGLFGIAIFQVFLFTYVAINVLSGRPDWFNQGFPVIIFSGASGGLIGAVLTHMISLGQSQERLNTYIAWLTVSVVIGLVAGLVYYLTGGFNVQISP